MHLDPSTYAALRRGSLDPVRARALAGHLDSGCEVCEAFLAARGGSGHSSPDGLTDGLADGLDGLVDQALVTAAPPSGGQGGDLEFARIMRQVRSTGAPRPAGHGRRRLGVVLTIAASLVGLGVMGLLAPRLLQREPAWDGLKGEAGPAVPLRLRFLVVRPGPGGVPEIEKGVAGQEVPSAASLQFEVRLGRPAWVTLLRSGSGGADTFFEGRLEAGSNLIQLRGQPAAYPLASLAGPQRFLALAHEGDAHLEPADVARAATLGADARQAGGSPISVDVVEVQVRP
jgi:hypothetical protein